MRPVLSDEQIAVFDDVLPESAFLALWDALQAGPYERVHQRAIEGVWRLLDGDPLRGPAVAATTLPIEALLPEGVEVSALPVRLHPTGGPVDALIASLLESASGVEGLIGRASRDWGVLLGSPFLYTMGTGLSWHCDAGPYTGAFIFYAHPDWNAQWGGELLVAEGCREYAAADREDGRRHRLDNTRESELLLRAGVGRYVAPKPNRLVILAGGTPHKITPVLPAAGQHPRASIAGFFVKPEGIAELLAQAH
jgi:hypothetical protein